MVSGRRSYSGPSDYVYTFKSGQNMYTSVLDVKSF